MMRDDGALSATDAMDLLEEHDDEVYEADIDDVADDEPEEEITESEDVPEEVDADGADEPTEGEDEEGAEVEPEVPAIDAPSFMDATERAKFASLPTEAQQIVASQSSLLQADYTRKTQEVATKSKQLDANLQQLGEVVSDREARLAEWKKVDWVNLSQTDPQNYQFYRAQMEAEQQEFEDAKALKAQVEADRLRVHVEEQTQQLKHVLPEALDPKKGPEIVRDVQTAMTEAGIGPETQKWVTAGQMALIYDAVKWRKSQAKKVNLRPKSDAKTTARPVRAKSRASSSRQGAKRSDAFRKNPTKRNAMAAIMELDD